jgi:hypothetical protein
MQPIIVMPMHDPTGLMFPQLEAITPQLKHIFGQAFVSVTRITHERWPEYVNRLGQDDFFSTLIHPTDVPVGADFLALYARAAAACPPDAVLHLCFIDRVAFSLQSHYREQFIADIRAVTEARTPLIFQRSNVAWETHPRNYRELEAMMTRVGELLFQKSLDFAWCHLAVQAGQLHAIAPHIKQRDLSIMAELVLSLKDQIQIKEVDWLAWEDPFIYARDPQQLKQEREESLAEIRKRLGYVIPMLQLLNEIGHEKN